MYRFAIRHKKRVLLIACLALTTILMVSGLLFWYANQKTEKKSEKCREELSSLDSSFSSKNRQERAKSLEILNKNDCKNLFDKPAKFSQLYYEAVFKFQEGDKPASKDYAKQALKMNNEMSAEEREKVYSQTAKVFSLNDIQDGVYVEITPQQRMIVDGKKGS